MGNHFNLSVMPEVLNRASSLGFKPTGFPLNTLGNDGDVVTILRPVMLLILTYDIREPVISLNRYKSIICEDDPYLLETLRRELLKGKG